MFLPALDLLSVSEMCVSVSKKLCRTTNAKQGPLRRSHEVCFCLGRPGLQQRDRPSRPQGAWGQPCRRPAGVTQEAGWTWGQLRLGPWVLFLRVAAADVFMSFLFCSKTLPQKAAPRALCRLMEGSCLQVLFGVDLYHLHLPLPGHFL